jgi:hypothetical protein
MASTREKADFIDQHRGVLRRCKSDPVKEVFIDLRATPSRDDGTWWLGSKNTRRKVCPNTERARWVRPFWGGLLRAVSYQGQREDKPARQVVRSIPHLDRKGG